jgi:hypothetical protein
MRIGRMGSLLVFISTAALSAINEQTNWMGGAGIPGPVTNWGTQYYQSDSVTAATEGQISLVATQWDYTASGWIKHIIDADGGIYCGYQGFMPADIDNDGDLDFVAAARNFVVWYRNDGNWNYVGQDVGTATTTDYPCVWPEDLDKDGEPDILSAGAVSGVGWYKNLGNGTGWQYKNLDNTVGYHRVSATDVDLDGDIDVIAVDNSGGTSICGDIYLFRNNGSQNFTKEIVADLPVNEGWRVYPADFNNDGFPDIYSVCYNSNYIFLNDETGHFAQSFNADCWPGSEFDGAWACDINMDGWMDLVTANQYNNAAGHPFGFYGFINDGTGCNYTLQFLVSDPTKSYMDGAMARDIDLDGFPDIAGTLFEVGWFRQFPYGTFTPYKIDNAQESHWIYVEHNDRKCMPSMDLLVTDMGAHIVYENKMLKAFASCGQLTSSILDFGALRQLKWFGWKACIPGDSTLAFYWRADSIDAMAIPWVGPYYAIQEKDSFPLPNSPVYRYFQYKAKFRPNKSPFDIAVLESVWVKHDTIGASSKI